MLTSTERPVRLVFCTLNAKSLVNSVHDREDGGVAHLHLHTAVLVADGLGLLCNLLEDDLHLPLEVIQHGLHLTLHVGSQGPDLLLNVGSNALNLLLKLTCQRLKLSFLVLQEGPAE